jgi:Transposase DDE domain
MSVYAEGMNWDWAVARRFLPFDLDALAVETGALTRRRGVDGGEALARCLLLLGLKNSTLERASKAAKELGISSMNKTAYLKRVCISEEFLKRMFFQTLSFGVAAEPRWAGLRLIAVDASCLSGPGAKTTDYKLHTVYDLCRGLPISIEITDRFGGEALWRHAAFGKGDLVLADAGYGYNRSFIHALETGADILIRFNFKTVTLMDELGDRVPYLDADEEIPATGNIERIVFLPGWETPLRAIGFRNDLEEPGWLLTSLNRKQLPTEQVRDLYRRRWQVELYFKRLKSLMDMGDLPSRDGPTARPWIWTKLILASLATLMAYERFSPWESQGEENQGNPQSKSMEGERLRANGHRKGVIRTSHKTQERKTQRKAKEKATTMQAVLLLEA